MITSSTVKVSRTVPEGRPSVKGRSLVSNEGCCSSHGRKSGHGLICVQGRSLAFKETRRSQGVLIFLLALPHPSVVLIIGFVECLTGSVAPRSYNVQCVMLRLAALESSGNVHLSHCTGIIRHRA